MKNLNIQIEIDSRLYSKNPDTSELGRKIISEGIKLISEMGWEAFTFRKLGAAIESPESSVYRYFRSKHSLLVYLTSWYWTWTEYRLVFQTANMDSPVKKLTKAVEILTQPVLIDNAFSHINEVLLSEIIFSESIKAYHTQEVDKENKMGCFAAFQSVVKRVGRMVLELNPSYQYPNMLISTIIEGAHQQKYFAEHMPTLTDIDESKKTITSFYLELITNTIQKQ